MDMFVRFGFIVDMFPAFCRGYEGIRNVAIVKNGKAACDAPDGLAIVFLKISDGGGRRRSKRKGAKSRRKSPLKIRRTKLRRAPYLKPPRAARI